MFNNYLICCFLSLFWVGFVWYFAIKFNSVINPTVITAATFLINYPVKLMLSYHGFYVMNSMIVSDNIVFLSILISNLGAAALICPMVVMGRRETVSCRSESGVLNVSAITALLFGIMLILYSYGLDAFISAFSLDSIISRIDGRTLEREGSGLSALVRCGALVFFIEFSIEVKKCVKFKFLLLGFGLIFSFFIVLVSGSKFEGLTLPILVIISYYSRLGVRSSFFHRFYQLGVYFGILIVALGLFGFIRGGGTKGFDENSNSESGGDHSRFMLAIFQITNAFDAPDNLIVLLDRSDSVFSGTIGFRLFLESIVYPLVPRFFWADKPLVTNNQVIMEYFFNERFSGHLGEAISPSFPGQMLATGGVFYMVVCCLLIGGLCGAIYKQSISQGGVFYILHVWLMLNMFNFMRSGLGYIGSFLVFASVCYFIIILKSILLNKGSYLSPVGRRD